MFGFKVQKAVLHPWKEKYKKEQAFDPIFHFETSRLFPRVTTIRKNMGPLSAAPTVTMYSPAELHRLWRSSQPIMERQPEIASVISEKGNKAKEAQDEIKAATPQVQVDEPEQEDDDDDGVLEERENLKTEEDYLKVDYEDEMRRLNKYLLAAQCHAIQKEQRRLKKQVQKTVKAENMRIHNIMEQERRQAIIKEMEKEAIRRQNCMELGKFQRQQIEEKREQKKREQEQEIQLLDTLKKQQEERYKSLMAPPCKWNNIDKEVVCQEMHRIEKLEEKSPEDLVKELEEDCKKTNLEQHSCYCFNRDRRLIQDALVYEKEKQQRLKQEEIKQNSDVCEK